MTAYISVLGQKREWTIRAIFKRPIMIEYSKKSKLRQKKRRQCNHAVPRRTY